MHAAQIAAALPRPATFSTIMSAGMTEAADGWVDLTSAHLALVSIAAHAGMEIVQARVSDDRAVTDTELWIALPSGALGAIGFRSPKGCHGNRGFSYFGEQAEQAELRRELISRLELSRGAEVGDVFSALTEIGSRA